MPQITTDTAMTQIRELGKAVGEKQINFQEFVKGISDGEGKISFELYDELSNLSTFLNYVLRKVNVR